MSTLSKVRSLVWILQRPTLYPHLMRTLYSRVTSPPEEDSSAESVAWCSKYSVSTEEALAHLYPEVELKPLSELHKKDYDRALEIERSCPVWMGGPADLELLHHLVKYSGAKTVVETGVAYGWSSLSILLALEGREGAKLYSTDMPYMQSSGPSYVGCVVARTELRKMWELYRLPDQDALPAIFDKSGTIDLCHYDSDKSYRGRMWASALIWSYLKSGGLLICDDIGDNVGFRDFAQQIDQKPIVIKVSTERHTKFVGVLKKFSSQ